jgi:hypothetical protein
MAALQEQENTEPRENLPPKPGNFSDIYWQSFVHMALSEDEALSQKEWAALAFPNERFVIRYGRIGNVVNGRLEKLCQVVGTKLHIVAPDEISRTQRYWRDPIGTVLDESGVDQPTKTYTTVSRVSAEKPTPLIPPTLSRKTYSGDPGKDFRELTAVIHIGEGFRDLTPYSEDEFYKRYPYERRIKPPGYRINSSFK